MSTQMKSPDQLKSEFSAQAVLHEEAYNKIRDSISYALQKSLTIKGALDTFELKVAVAVSELEIELQTINSNFNKCP